MYQFTQSWTKFTRWLRTAESQIPEVLLEFNRCRDREQYAKLLSSIYDHKSLQFLVQKTQKSFIKMEALTQGNIHLMVFCIRMLFSGVVRRVFFPHLDFSVWCFSRPNLANDHSVVCLSKANFPSSCLAFFFPRLTCFALSFFWTHIMKIGIVSSVSVREGVVDLESWLLEKS